MAGRRARTPLLHGARVLGPRVRRRRDRSRAQALEAALPARRRRRRGRRGAARGRARAPAVGRPLGHVALLHLPDAVRTPRPDSGTRHRVLSLQPAALRAAARPRDRDAGADAHRLGRGLRRSGQPRPRSDRRRVRRAQRAPPSGRAPRRRVRRAGLRRVAQDSRPPHDAG